MSLFGTGSLGYIEMNENGEENGGGRGSGVLYTCSLVRLTRDGVNFPSDAVAVLAIPRA